MKKATTTSAAAKTLKMTAAKVTISPDIEAAHNKKTSGILLAFTVGSSPRPHKPRYQQPQAVNGHRHGENRILPSKSKISEA